LSVIVPAGDRADVIEDCLRSVRWADEVLVVDSFSRDGTLAVADKYADRVLRHEYGNSALQKNWAIPQARHPWVLIVDTDERVTAPLRAEIEAVLAAGGPAVGYRVPRLNIVLGQTVRHAAYYPDYQIRLFQRDLGRYNLRRVHAHVLLDGPCGTLQAPLVHYAHRSLDQTLRGLLLGMTTWEAEQRSHEAQAAGRAPDRGLGANLLLRPAAAFGLRYFRQGGWRDGRHGLALSLIWAMYVAITYLKVWEQALDLPPQWWTDDWHRRPDYLDAADLVRAQPPDDVRAP
jgi:hypothetical protein